MKEDKTKQVKREKPAASSPPALRPSGAAELGGGPRKHLPGIPQQATILLPGCTWDANRSRGPAALPRHLGFLRGNVLILIFIYSVSQTSQNRHKTCLSHKKRGFICLQKVNAALMEVCAPLKSVAT